MGTGSIIFLNGTSSAGKSTLAAALQNLLDEPFLYLSIDDYLARFPASFWKPYGISWTVLPRLISGFHQEIVLKANAGHRVIVDHVLEQNQWLEECIRLFDGIEVIFVGVHCPLEELERREVKRGNRQKGTARYQYERVHAHSLYDLELDTSLLTPEACATLIVEYLKAGLPLTAFKQLKQNLS